MGPSPPRTKKEASVDAEQRKALAAAEGETAKAERTVAKEAAKEERRVAKEAAREQRRRAAVEREALRQAEKAERATVRAEANVEVAAAEAGHEAAKTAVVQPEPEPEPEPSTAPVPAGEERRQARTAKSQEREEAKVARRQQREEAKAAKITAATKATKTAKTAGSADPLVEPPPAISDGSDPASNSPWQRLAVGLLVLGALGLLCSVILAVGALLAAVDAHASDGATGLTSRVCDVLVGPLGGLFEFSGENAESKTDLVTRGVASMVYLAAGLSLPALARRSDV